MSCGGVQNTMSSMILAWTSGLSATDLFVPATPPIRTSEVSQAIVTLDVQAVSDETQMEVVRSYQTSQDGLTWDTPVTLADSGAVSAVGRSYGSSPTTIPFAKAWVRFGVTTNQKAGSDLEQMRLGYLLSLVKR